MNNIVIKIPDSNNKDNILYKAFYQKLINTFWNNNFLRISNRDKLKDLVLKKIVPS